MSASQSHQQLRCCHCSVRSNATAAAAAGIPPTVAAPLYIAPTRAIVMHLSGFPAAMLHPFAIGEAVSTMPHLQTLLDRATSMRLKWQEDAAGFAAASAVCENAPAASDRALSTTLRLLGLDPSEQTAAALRAGLLQQQRVASGVSASPAAAYPSAFGRAKVELATNQLGVWERVRRERETRKRLESAAANNAAAESLAYLNAPVFLDPQAALHPSNHSGGASPFLAASHPPLQSHSSVPLQTEQHRSEYIRCIVRHVAERLGLVCIADGPGLEKAVDPAAPPPAHILLLHIDADALVGVPSSNQENREFRLIALQFIEQLLTALLTQLETPTAAPSLKKDPAAPYPPALASLPTLPAAASIQLLPAKPHAMDAPRHAAEQLLSSVTSSQSHICQRIMWVLVVDNQEEDSAQPNSPALNTAQQKLLAFLKPVQSFQVQDGIVDPRREGWMSCMAYVWHAESTRIPSPHSSSTAPPVQGAVHMAHLMKEIVFKVGLGNKYGA